MSITTKVVRSNPALVRFTQYSIMWLNLSMTDARSMVFSGTPVSAANKTDRHNITEILSKVKLGTIILTLTLYSLLSLYKNNCVNCFTVIMQTFYNYTILLPTFPGFHCMIYSALFVCGWFWNKRKRNIILVYHSVNLRWFHSSISITSAVIGRGICIKAEHSNFVGGGG